MFLFIYRKKKKYQSSIKTKLNHIQIGVFNPGAYYSRVIDVVILIGGTAKKQKINISRLMLF